MRHNGRAPVNSSDMAPNRVSLHRGERPQVACPLCGRWRLVQRGMLQPHRADDGRTRCPGSGQRVRLESPERWRQRLELALCNPSLR